MRMTMPPTEFPRQRASGNSVIAGHADMTGDAASGTINMKVARR
jgi:hypothetical protein